MPTQIRILLLVLITTLTILTHIFSVLAPTKFTAKAGIPLFIYADLDLFLVFILTFLPFIRMPEGRLK
jgi:hypothetical protein